MERRSAVPPSREASAETEPPVSPDERAAWVADDDELLLLDELEDLDEAPDSEADDDVM